MRYFACFKCGSLASSESDVVGCCPAPFPVRISGVCAGGYFEITEDEYNRRLQEMKDRDGRFTVTFEPA